MTATKRFIGRKGDDMGKGIDSNRIFLPKNEQTNRIIELLLEYSRIFDKKHSDYGPNNIAKFGEIGCLVRLNDKLERLITLLMGKKEPSVDNESVEDTWFDVIGYAVIALACRRGLWLEGEHLLNTTPQAEQYYNSDATATTPFENHTSVTHGDVRNG